MGGSLKDVKGRQLTAAIWGKGSPPGHEKTSAKTPFPLLQTTLKKAKLAKLQDPK